MTQGYFNMIAVSVAQVAVHTGKSEHDTLKELLPNLDHPYADPLEVSEIGRVAKEIREMVKGMFMSEAAGNFTQLKYCIKHYGIDGKKLRKRIFGGARFVHEKVEIQNKADMCLRDIACHMLNSTSGKTPLAPDGWHL